MSATMEKWPLIHLSRSGTMAVLLKHDVVVELLCDHTVRVVCPNEFSVLCDANGKTLGILHRRGKILKTNNSIACMMDSPPHPRHTDDQRIKQIAFGKKGILFSMSHLKQAMFISSSSRTRQSKNNTSWYRNGEHISTIPADQVVFAKLDYDFTLHGFYANERASDKSKKLASQLVSSAVYHFEDEGLFVSLHGVKIKQNKSGDVVIENNGQYIKCSPKKASVEIRAGGTELFMDLDWKALIKDGGRRAHVSRSGMVIGDGVDLAMVDQNGRIVGC